MPTALRVGPYRFYFYSHDASEPPHMHVDRESMSAKFWLDPVGLAFNRGFGARELWEVQRLVLEHRVQLVEEWHGYFGGRR